MSLLHRGRKPVRPIDWEDWEEERKITWLKNRKKPTASEQKELKYYLQIKKFRGFAEWLHKRREKEKTTEAYQKKQRKKCCENRGVQNCKECCRYEHCINGKPLYDIKSTGTGEMRLGHAIILSIENDIRRCYKHGWKDQMTFWIKVLASERTNILTAETVDGYASAQAILAECYKKYGDFEKIYQKCQETYKPQLEELEAKLTTVKAESTRADAITEQINRTLKKLYGDTV